MLEILKDVFTDSVLDTAKMLPFLFLAYIVIEFIEHRKSDAIERVLARGGRWGFVPGAALGLLPQCGFSAMAANFYASRVVTLGTMLAVFLATSDEAIPILLANPGHYGDLALLLGIKFVWAVLAGFFVDFVLTRFLPAQLRGGYTGSAAQVDCNEDDEEDGILLSALKHTVNIGVYILGFTLLFGLLVEWVGEGRIEAIFEGMGVFQPLAAGLFGLIPNCASSVLLTQLYLSGTISFGSVLAGLCTNAGVGITVLFKSNKGAKQNLFIVGLLYALGALLGVLVHVTGLLGG